MNRTIRAPELIEKTDLCVKCGLCLPHCPSYNLRQDENESPRGRIALIQGWAQGELEAGEKLVSHTDHCLLCRACETACPAKVPYAEILDKFRSKVRGTRTPYLRKFRRFLLTRMLATSQSDWLSGKVRLLAKSRPGIWAARLLGFREIALGLPETFAPEPPARAQKASRIDSGNLPVQFFVGCTGRLLDAETLDACLNLIEHLGFSPEIPENQSCCGALDLHAGNAEEAERLARKNTKAFGEKEHKTIVGCASGCGAMLKEYPEALGNLGERFEDISDFLSQASWPEDLEVAPLHAQAVLHTPCSLRNVLKTQNGPLNILKRIPGLQLIELPVSQGCCGAAGSFMIEHPNESRAYREKLLDSTVSKSPDFLLTSNPGCAIHLRAGLRERGLGALEVLHPATLLWRQIQIKERS